jgi:UDP-glucuronate 4-epimerase
MTILVTGAAGFIGFHVCRALLGHGAEVVGIDALTRLYERREDHSQALDMMGQLVRLTQDPKQVVDLRFRMGRILDVHR